MQEEMNKTPGEENTGNTENTVNAQNTENTAPEAQPAPARKGKKAKKKKTVGQEIREWVVSLVVAFAIVFVLRSFLFTIIRVDGMSMYSTLNDGERLFTTVYDVKFGTVNRGDVVICEYPNRTTKYFGFITAPTNFVKRVVAVPGDTVYRQNGVTHVIYSVKDETGTRIYDEALDEGNTIYNSSPDYDKYVLGEDEYFVVGDNRNNSHDSRDWNDYDPSRDVGPITKSMIVSKVKQVIWPLDAIRTIE